MLITTSRKPSQRTRTFCRGLERVLKARCVNRGKMSLRDIFLKVKEMGMDGLMVISEQDGNPNGMNVYLEGELFASLKLTVDLALPKSRIKKDEIRIRCEIDKLKDFIPRVFRIPLEESGEDLEGNLLWIRTRKQKSAPVMEFFDINGQPTGPRIYLQGWKLTGEENDSS
ncbi:MAG: Brix domain-containing protein [Methanobacterium sp.]|nr:Brix domain-containing protein [Methanobacterium sp.]